METERQIGICGGDKVNYDHEDFWKALDELVNTSEIVIDRPKGSTHPRFPNFIYRVDYGYLKNTASIAHSIRSAAQERPGWLEGVIDYHVNGAYGKSISAEGFYGYILCLEERQAREMRILTKLPVCSYVLDNPQRDWKAARKRIQTILMNTADGPETTQR